MGELIDGCFKVVSDLRILACSTRPTDRSCWRFSFRHHLQKALYSDGCMLQLIEYDQTSGTFKLGDGQKIETLIANELGVKIFQVQLNQKFGQKQLDKLWHEVIHWDSNRRADMSGVTISFSETA